MTPSIRSVASTSSLATLCFREIRTLDEMRQAAALRFKLYRRTAGIQHVASLDPVTQLDLDAFDLVSHQFALFEEHDGLCVVMGTLRVTTGERSPQTALVHDLASEAPTLRSRVHAAREALLPMLCYLPQTPKVQARVVNWKAAGERIAEPGRLTVHPRLRSSAGRVGLRASEFMLLCAKAAGWYVMGLDRVLVDCDSSLAPFYERYGFGAFREGASQKHADMGISISVLHATPQTLPLALRPVVASLAEELRESGSISWNRFLAASAAQGAAGRTPRHRPDAVHVEVAA